MMAGPRAPGIQRPVKTRSGPTIPTGLGTSFGLEVPRDIIVTGFHPDTSTADRGTPRLPIRMFLSRMKKDIWERKKKGIVPLLGAIPSKPSVSTEMRKHGPADSGEKKADRREKQKPLQTASNGITGCSLKKGFIRRFPEGSNVDRDCDFGRVLVDS